MGRMPEILSWRCARDALDPSEEVGDPRYPDPLLVFFDFVFFLLNFFFDEDGDDEKIVTPPLSLPPYGLVYALSGEYGSTYGVFDSVGDDFGAVGDDFGAVEDTITDSGAGDTDAGNDMESGSPESNPSAPSKSDPTVFEGEAAVASAPARFAPSLSRS